MAAKRRHPAIIFLGIMAVLAVIGAGVSLWFFYNQDALMRTMFVPEHAIADEPLGPAPDYADNSAWAARPGMASRASMLPEGLYTTMQIPLADVFYIHPTTFLENTRWNADFDSEEARPFLERLGLQHQASAFSTAGRVFAPRYRQAGIGAFFDESGQGAQAIVRAHGDVLAAFDHYMENDNAGRPFIIAGHSQGSLHGLLLLAERIVARGLQDKLIAAYLIGWPVSMEGDIGALPGLSPCEKADQTGCIISYQSFAQGGDAGSIVKAFEMLPGLNGQPHAGTTMLCTNPLNWQIDGAAPAGLNAGALMLAEPDTPSNALEAGLTGASCGGDGILYINPPPKDGWTDYLMPQGNYHVYDINLFYKNIMDNAVDRTRAWFDGRPDVLPGAVPGAAGDMPQ